MDKHIYTKVHKPTCICPYCGAKLYDDEMCRCQFEDEYEIKTEVAIRTEVTIKTKPSSEAPISVIPAADCFCESCGARLQPGEICGCKGISAPTPRQVITGGHGVVKAEDNPAPAPGHSGLKSTMRTKTPDESASGEHLGKSSYLSKATDLD